MTDIDSTIRFWQHQWPKQLEQFTAGMSDAQQEATAGLVTVLLCGEQSATKIFAAEISRSRDRASMSGLQQLINIERDEHIHEQALTAVIKKLPAAEGLHGHKRRAQRFFASLGRIDRIADQFRQITHLDTAVCKIMWHIENSRSQGMEPLRLLTGQIKKDEARHVAVSRRYAGYLGMPAAASRIGAEQVSDGLVSMLEPLGGAFETIGVDCDKLFSHLLRHPPHQ
jgi:hypothetical protein